MTYLVLQTYKHSYSYKNIVTPQGQIVGYQPTICIFVTRAVGFHLALIPQTQVICSL